MHSLLEEYLSKLGSQLGALPIKQRTEGLREMQAHLENAVRIRREQGQSEDEAVRTVVAQFGSPEAVGQETIVAWQRGKILSRRSFLGASAITTLILCLGFFVMNQYIGSLANVLPHWFLIYCNKNKNCGMALVHGTFLITFGLAGLAAGLLFPKRAVWGTCLGLAFFWVGWAAVDGIGQLQMLFDVQGLTRQGRGSWVVISIAFAWVGSRSWVARRGWLAQS